MMETKVTTTFIILDKNIEKASIALLSTLLQENEAPFAEFVFFSQKNIPPHKYFQTYGPQELSKALVETPGKWIVFLKLDALLEHFTYLMSTPIHRFPGYVAVVMPPSKGIGRIVGVRRVGATPFVCVRKQFLTTDSHLPITPDLATPPILLQLVKVADRFSALLFINDGKLINEGDGSNILPRTPFVRPYLHIIRNLSKRFATRIWKAAKRRVVSFIEHRNQPSAVKLSYTSNIPVFINCRDRVEPLKSLVNWLESEGLKNIIFLDNNSSYPPLVNYLKQTTYSVLWLRDNVGHTAPWDSGAINSYAAGRPYIVTDPDVIPVDEAHGAIKRFFELLNKYPKYQKVGFGLKIDDLPDSYELKQTVINWESQFWKKSIEDNVFVAEIDTTFALYRPGSRYILQPALRTGGKFVARHEPWYIDSASPNDEVMYYRAHANKHIGTWGVESGDLADLYTEYEGALLYQKS